MIAFNLHSHLRGLILLLSLEINSEISHLVRDGVIPALRRLRKEDHKFKASLVTQQARPCLKNMKDKKEGEGERNKLS
jgi:hypothetical protein